MKDCGCCAITKPRKDPLKVLVSSTLADASLGKSLANNTQTWRLENFGLLNQRQFGFRLKISTVNALLYFVNNINQGLVEGKITVVVMIEFEAAFLLP